VSQKNHEKLIGTYIFLSLGVSFRKHENGQKETASNSS